MTDSPEMIVLFNNSHFGLTSCGKESQSSPRWRAFSFGCASAEGEGALKGRAVGHRPSLGQDEHGVSSGTFPEAKLQGCYPRSQQAFRISLSHRGYECKLCAGGSVFFDEIFKRRTA
ncbi:hypothetical protein P4608_26075 [Ensifer adhaerens]|nr:hypothetical protein [Ensifer adhaerens]MDF8357540.1 hypothetical protein [Ensifer adhaerens]